MIRRRWPLLGLLVAAGCGPQVSTPSADTDGSSSDPTTVPTEDGPATSTSGEPADGSTDAASTSGPAPTDETGPIEPLPCANIDPTPDETCWVEHVLPIESLSIALTDHDLDGRLDLVVGEGCPTCSPDRSVARLLLRSGQADGSFAAPEELAVLEDGTSAWSWMLPLGPGPDGASRILTMRNVQGGFLAWEEAGVLHGDAFVLDAFGDAPPELPSSHDEIAAADVDGDGIDDAVLMQGPELIVLVSETSGTFAPAPHDLGLDFPFVDALYAADADGDGRDDVLLVHGSLDTGAVNHETFTGAWAYAQPDGSFSPVGPVSEWTLPLGVDVQWSHASLSDLDADGMLDVLARYRRFVSADDGSLRDRIVVLPGIEGGFGEQVETELDGDVLALAPVMLAGDDVVDVAVRTDPSEDELRLMSGAPGQPFAEAIRLALSHDPSEFSFDLPLWAADLNGDDIPDFVTGIYTGDTASLSVLLSRP